MEHTKTIREIIDWFSHFNKYDVIIKTKSKEFEIEMKDRNLPHLLGLHYSSDRPLKGRRLLNAIKNLSDQEIYGNIEKYNPSRLEMVKSRIDYFKYFMENLENAYLYEQSHPDTKIKSEFLLVDMEDGNYLHLGIGNNGIEDYLETFIVRHDDSYFKSSQIKEQVEGLYRLDELMIPVPFSFDLEKNRALEEERRRRLEEVFYKDTDKDGLVDTLEQSLGTNPYAMDSDADGVTDIAEFGNGRDPKEPHKKEMLQKMIDETSQEALQEDNFITNRTLSNQMEI